MIADLDHTPTQTETHISTVCSTTEEALQKSRSFEEFVRTSPETNELLQLCQEYDIREWQWTAIRDLYYAEKKAQLHTDQITTIADLTRAKEVVIVLGIHKDIRDKLDSLLGA